MNHFSHPVFSRRQAVQAGAVGIFGMGMNHLSLLQASEKSTTEPKAKSVIYIFLSGGLAQQDSFDMKPDAPDEIRGEFKPIATKTPGIDICEHLPNLAQRSEKWSLVRSLTHPYNEHSEGHMVMLTGKTPLPKGFNPSSPRPTDHPAMVSVCNEITQPKNNLPPSIVLPEIIKHRTGRVIPGQFAGVMGAHRDPYFLESSRYNATSYGAWPKYGFHHARGGENPKGMKFLTPTLTLPEGFSQTRFNQRIHLLNNLTKQQRELERVAETASFDRFSQRAVSMLADEKMKNLFDVTNAPQRDLDRYGRHAFGWSLLLARRLVEAGVNMVQVNLGNNETWDTHGNAFPNLKNYLLPPMDQSVSALLDDLSERGMLDDTLIVMAGEFGRTPKVFGLPKVYAKPGRDHWGKVQTVFFAGGGVKGGNIIGSSDKFGGEPAASPQKPENMASSIYQALGVPKFSNWHDLLDRPIPVYEGNPIPGLI